MAGDCGDFHTIPVEPPSIWIWAEMESKCVSLWIPLWITCECLRGSPVAVILVAMRTIQEIKQRNIEMGQHFFDANAMTFFDSQVHPDVFGDYFVTSEATPEPGLRRYSVRKISWSDGVVFTVGNFCAHKTLQSAYAEAKYFNQRATQTE